MSEGNKLALRLAIPVLLFAVLMGFGLASYQIYTQFAIERQRLISEPVALLAAIRESAEEAILMSDTASASTLIASALAYKQVVGGRITAENGFLMAESYKAADPELWRPFGLQPLGRTVKLRLPNPLESGLFELQIDIERGLQRSRRPNSNN